MSDKLWNTFLTVSQEIGLRLLACAAVYIVGRFIIRHILHLATNWKPLQKRDATVASFTHEILRIGLNAVLLLSLVGIMGIPMASMVTLFASIGLAISMALQGSLGNLASGIMLMLFRPYDVGNDVKIDDITGSVKEIGLFYTSILTYDNTRVSIPNSRMMNVSIFNFSREKNRRVDIHIYTQGDQDIEKTMEVLREAVPKDERILRMPEEPKIYLAAMNKDSLDYIVQLWTKSYNYFSLKTELQRELVKAVQQAGIQSPKQFIDSQK